METKEILLRNRTQVTHGRLYIPKTFTELVGLKEGDTVVITLYDDKETITIKGVKQ